MRKIFFYLTVLSGVIFVFSCSETEKESVQKSNEVADKAQASIEERRKKGDTLALSPEVLSKALPESVSSYKKEGLIQKTEDKTVGMNWSSVSQNYSDGEKTILLVISDYNGAYGLYAGATAIFNSGISIQTEDELSKPFMSNGKVSGWESFDKETGAASLMLGKHDRFLITIQSVGQENMSTLYEFANLINLEF